MNDIFKLARIQMLIILLFVCFKFIRPPVLDSNAPNLFKIILLSLPNFFEGILGVLIVTGIGLYVQNKIVPINKQLKTHTLYLVATIMATIYVVTQELRIHNLGGYNVFDQNDLLFSGIGLLTGYFLICWMKPKISTS